MPCMRQALCQRGRHRRLSGMWGSLSPAMLPAGRSLCVPGQTRYSAGVETSGRSDGFGRQTLSALRPPQSAGSTLLRSLRDVADGGTSDLGRKTITASSTARYGASPSPTDFPPGQQSPWASPTDKHRAASPTGRIRTSPSPEVPSRFFFDPLGGVKPDEDLDGVPASEVAKFVQANTQYYLPVFTNQKKFRKNRFNFCAFLCTGGWMLYRKQYKLGAILTVVMAGLYFLALYCNMASENLILRLMSQAGIDCPP